tara:strand:- start:187 stop:693 length:507 start_codon:yes stop_codon:yes gene_type:complete
MVSWKSKEELHEIFAPQFERFKEIESELDEMFKYKWFLTYTFRGNVAGEDINGALEKHNRHCLKLSRVIRGHFPTLPVFPVNGERTHLHAKAWSDVEIPTDLMTGMWKHSLRGLSHFRPWEDGIGGDAYVYREHKMVGNVRPYCGCNRQPCKSKKGNHCVYRDILKSL